MVFKPVIGSEAGAAMRLDKKFLARLLGVEESEVTNISGLTFELATPRPDRLASFKSLLNERHIKRMELLAAALRAGPGNLDRTISGVSG